jgi:hypothetical protein
VDLYLYSHDVFILMDTFIFLPHRTYFPPDGRRPLRRPRRRWEDNIKIDLEEVGWGAWTGLIWLRIGTGGELL